MSDLAKVRAALESRLNGMAGSLPTAWENIEYTPALGTPWQRVRVLVNDPIDYAITADVVEQRGILEVLLFYPRGAGTATAAAMAKAIADRFAPVQTLTSSTTTVEIVSTASIGTAFPADEWWCVPVSIQWRSFT
jgi:hypothetical protein